MKKFLHLLFISALLPLSAAAQAGSAAPADTLTSHDLDDVTVTAHRAGMLRMGGAENGIMMNKAELFKAACCNLGESFTTNPSVDVNYSDATTGAKQIKLLGLSGTYVQMLTENLPNFRGAAAPYALDYVPGPWMHSIQVSKGASSVRNGYESITGQIDIEYLKPDDEQGVTLNLYGNTLSRFEANADANLHLDSRLSTEVLAHYQDDWGHHDENHDGFLDQPNVRQYNLQNRWKWRGDRYLFHGGLSLLKEEREGGQNHMTAPHTAPEVAPLSSPEGDTVVPTIEAPSGAVGGAMSELWKSSIQTDRYEGYMKHAFILDPTHGTNIALMATASLHQMDATYGHKTYSIDEKNAYAQLLFETNFTERHNLSAGFSFNYDKFDQDPIAPLSSPEGDTVVPTIEAPSGAVGGAVASERVFGLYAQYTYNLHDRLTLMAGLRADHSNRYGTFVTPRLHLKYTPASFLTLRLSAGKGYRTVHALAENTYLLASGRTLLIDPLEQEQAWNYGISSAFYIPLFGQTLKLNAEYYHTHFHQQAVIDYDTDPTLIHITNLRGRSYSNTLQVDATYPFFSGFDLTAAYRLNDVKTTYGGQLMTKSLTSRYKALLTASYKTPLELWQFDATLQLNGGGRLPRVAPPSSPEGDTVVPTIEAPSGAVGGAMSSFHSYAQLNLQVTRWFRHFSIYAGGENLTGFRQKQTILHAEDPWSTQFDPTLVWGPVHGAVGYVGIRVNIGKI